jgi:hypothetical protein
MVDRGIESYRYMINVERSRAPAAGPGPFLPMRKLASAREAAAAINHAKQCLDRASRGPDSRDRNDSYGSQPPTFRPR